MIKTKCKGVRGDLFKNKSMLLSLAKVVNMELNNF